MVRQKSFVRYFFGLWGWLALAGAFGTVIFCVVGQSTNQIAQRLNNEGAETTAEITRAYRSSDRDADGDVDYDYNVFYRFTVNGRSFEDEQQVSYAFYKKTETGSRVPVRYWVNDPSVSEIERGASATGAWISWIGAAIFGLGTLVLAKLGWKRARTATWMISHGVEREATITGLVETMVEVNSVKRWRANWREAGGRTGSTYMRRIGDLPGIGTRITVLSDPEGQRDSIWTGDL
jgi:Protein of unknown function (DUF3592)